jgi:penicillin-binding protein activator
MNGTRIATMAALALAVGGSGGCALFRASTTEVDVGKDTHYRADYDFSDMRKVSEGMAGDLLASEFMGKQTEPPVYMIAGVENRTSMYVDTKGLTDRVRTLMFQSGKARFVNEARRADLLKEQGFQAANVTPEQQVALGKQLGAKYMMSGSLMEMESSQLRQVRLAKKEMKYYKLTMEVTDLESGEISWTTEKEFAREASKPLIGW